MAPFYALKELLYNGGLIKGKTFFLAVLFSTLQKAEGCTQEQGTDPPWALVLEEQDW